MAVGTRRTLLAYAALALLGIAILLHLLPAAPAAGLALLCAGSVGLAREARMAWLTAREAARRQREAAREALAATRRERATRQRQERQERREAEARARAAQATAQRAQRQQALTAQQEQERSRARRQEARETAAARWLSLSGAQLPGALLALFVRRGFTARPTDGDSLCDLLLEEPNGRQTLARCLAHAAGAADVQALDTWRRTEERSHAYLIALAGFSPQAVRLARTLPITLVEAHLLAAWEERVTGDE